MQVLVILAHPNPGSFNHAIAGKVVDVLQRKGYQVIFHDLHAEQFEPRITYEEIPKGALLDKNLERHCNDLINADGIIFIHPNWWGQPPAIMKGWIDRVFRPGIAYQFHEDDPGVGVPDGLLKAGIAMVFNTSDTPEQREREVFGDPLDRLWKNNLNYCGVKRIVRKTFGVIVTSSLEQRRGWLDEVENMVGEYFPEIGI